MSDHTALWAIFILLLIALAVQLWAINHQPPAEKPLVIRAPKDMLDEIKLIPFAEMPQPVRFVGFGPDPYGMGHVRIIPSDEP